ncbi:proline iminopeptidase-family hydrolase [Lysobacter sp. Root494]|uniref:proline iminopeptidase-family hydrolase n=1 Tax=Lysobacter sp. Root494 TaxID=1736549 RepID=UPI0006FBC906|nr:proline iminopeptidase-family hydrolase [Lysobacter sp. Root494]KQY51066.1 proline iminopeptidase [Lysobacter sp. Root494]
MKRFRLVLLLMLLCGGQLWAANRPDGYFDNAGRNDAWAGGIRLIPIHTPRGDFKVWTKRVGNNPRIKVLLLHGGPGGTHENFEWLDSYFPGEGIEYYYYDQLGSYYSDQADDPALNDLARSVEEVEQVRQALHLDKDNFYLMGHSFGGMLAMEYALKYQQHLKGLIVSSMMSSVPAYNRYASDVLMPELGTTALAELKQLDAARDYNNPRFEALLKPHYERHVLRLPMEQWPDPVKRVVKHMNPKVYIPMQGPGELGASGLLANWDRTADLPRIIVPTLVISGRYDTMDPAWMEMMSRKLPHGRFVLCPNGSHLAMYDDQQHYIAGVLRFIRDVDAAAQGFGQTPH